MRRCCTIALRIAALLLATASAGSAGDRVAFKVGRILTGTGTVLEDAVILVENGRIAAIGDDVKLPPGTRVVDLPHRIVIPGLVNPLTYLAGQGRTDEESVAPDVRAADGIDRFATNRRLLEGGVTSVYVAPGRSRLISGLGALAHTTGPAAGRVLVPVAALRMNLGERAKNPPTVFEPPVPPSADRPFRPSRRQLPTSRPGALLAIRQTFSAAREYLAARDRARTADAAAPPRNLAYEALVPVLAGKLPVRVNAHRAIDILSALDLAEELGFKLILIGATEAHKVADRLAAAKVPVVVNARIHPGRLYRVDETQDLDEGHIDLRNAARLAAHNVRVALFLPEEVNPGDLLLAAGYAARYGMPADKALMAVTLEAARVSGAADQVGSLETGKRADFVVLDRDPFDARCRPLEVYVGGERVFRRTAERPPVDVLAIRAGRVLTMAGRVLENATVLIEDGKITDLGSAVPVPSNARVVDIPGGVVTPGFIDALSHVGLQGKRDARRPAPAAPSPRGPRPRRPGPSRGRPAGRSGGSGIASVSLKESLADVVQPGHEAYPALLRAGVTSVILAPGGEAAAPLTAVKLGATTREALVLRRLAGVRYPMRLSDSASRKGAASKLDGVLKRARAYADSLAKYAKDLAAYRQARDAAETGKDDKTDKEGKAGKAGGAKLKEPKKPSSDPEKEAWLAVLERRAAVVVPIRREDTITAALEVFARYGVKPVLLQADDGHRVVAAVKARAAGLLAGPPFLRREPDGTPVFNALRLSDAGVPLGLFTAGTSGSKFLPLHAAFAVREGLPREAALRALTVTPARLYHLADRVGTLEVGKDGDLIVFSGDPFDFRSRIEIVVSDGRLVHDAREGVR